MGKGYWEFIISNEKEPLLPKNPHTTTNSN
jgi:hypothetical protein